MASFLERLIKPKKSNPLSYLRSVLAGSLYKVGDLGCSDSLSDIKTIIQSMRDLASDPQVATSLNYYSTDATTPNESGDIIWATPKDLNITDPAEVVNSLFNRWDINKYVRDHILELATVGNLYIPTTDLFREYGGESTRRDVMSLDINTIADPGFDIIPSYKLNPEDVIHLWYRGEPKGFAYQPESDIDSAYSGAHAIRYPESSIIHFSLGGLLGTYTIDGKNADGDVQTYDIQFATPLLQSALQPTQTLNLLENAQVLSSLVKVVRFVNIDCGNAEEEEIQATLQQIKDAIEQQLSLNTNNGDSQSFLNPSSPNNLIYLPKVNGQSIIDIVDLNMRDTDGDNDTLLNYFQDKKLSVLGIPKEALNFSSSEGLGGAGAVMSQRSALYANSLQRLENAYMSGWKEGLNKYFVAKGMSGYVDKFELHMSPVITEMSTVKFEKRDAAIGQATSLLEVLKSLNIDDKEIYVSALTEALSESFPRTSSQVNTYNIDVNPAMEEAQPF